MIVTKVCTRCGEEKPLTDFYKHKLSKDGHAFQCKDCSLERSRVYSKTPAGIHSRLRGRALYYKTKPFKLGREEFVDWYEDQTKKCVYCDIVAEDLPKLSDPFNDFSHRLTVDCKDNSIGYELDNIVLACRRCNSIKSDILTFDEMIYVGQNFIKPKWIKRLEGSAK